MVVAAAGFSSRSALGGPDGIETAAPLARTGMVSPALASRTAPRYPEALSANMVRSLRTLRERNHGSHYGFVEEGVIFSTLQPG